MIGAVVSHFISLFHYPKIGNDILSDLLLKFKETNFKNGNEFLDIKGNLAMEYEYFKNQDLFEKSLTLRFKQGFRIFLFHNALTELKTKDLVNIDSFPVSLLPVGFDYYAGGHVHVIDNQLIDSKRIVFPGPVFPNNFAELEKLQQGSFVIFDNGDIRNISLPLKKVVSVSIDADNKEVSFVKSELKRVLSIDVSDCIVLVRIYGTLVSGKPADLLWNDIFMDLYSRNAFVVLRNTFGFSSKEFEFISVNSGDDVEESVLKEHAGQFKLSDDDLKLVKDLINSLSIEKQDGERVSDFECRLFSELDNLFL